MLKANQNALLQETNNALLTIRNAELNYYQSFYLFFGGQAAIVGGFAYGSLTQIQFTLPHDITGYFYIQLTFWLSSAICLAASIHVILTTIFLQVFGPGLALHGPIGSMARAAHGMKSEIKNTFIWYVLMIASLAVNLLSSFWVLMEWKSGVVSSVVLAFSISLWWRYCSRIYNKFYVDSITSETEDHFDRWSATGDTNIAMSRMSNASIVLPFKTNKGSLHPGNDSFKDTSDSSAPSQQIGAAAIQANQVVKEGFLGKEGHNLKKGSFASRYFVLCSNGQMFYYKSKVDYLNNPKSPIKSRAIVVSEYFTVFKENCSSLQNSYRDASYSDIFDAVTQDPLACTFALILDQHAVDSVDNAAPTGEKRIWLLRCDSEDELRGWIEVLLSFQLINN